MDTGKVASEYRAAQWMQIIEERRTGGKTVKDFCLDRGISRDSYFYWQHKLRKAACSELDKPGALRPAAPKGWMQLAETNRTKPSLTIEIGGCRITVDSGTDPELLRDVCRILRTVG